MKIKVISGNVIHQGEIIGVGSIIDAINSEDAKRLCLDGLCELVDGDFEAETDAEIKEGVDLEELSKKELIAYAEQLGIKLDSRSTKAEMIEKIVSADAPTTEMP